MSLFENVMGCYRYKVNPKDVDFRGLMTVSALCDCVLQSAGEDADFGGFGVRNLQEHDATWVLSRLALETERVLGEHEEFSVTTWVESLDRIFTTRHHRVCDAKGDVVARATTQWSMINRTTRRLISLDWLGGCHTVDEKIGIERPAKLKPITDATSRETHAVRYSDIDFNGHTNTTRYFDWMFDMVELKRMEKGRVARLDANFLRESRYGDSVSLMMNTTECMDAFQTVLADNVIMSALVKWSLD